MITVTIEKQYLENLSTLIKETVFDIGNLPSEDYLAAGSKRIPEQLLHNFRVVSRLLDFEVNPPGFVPFLVSTETAWQSTEPSVSGTVTLLAIHT